MYFDENYFKGEEREGFYIKPMMKRAWAAQLEILEQIDCICERNNIEYFASSGTLLGAIRHGGYIPWDDDLDIEMKRADYDRFLDIAEKELPQGYKVANAASDSGWNEPFSRVFNTSEIPLRGQLLEKFHGFPWRAGVDIFPIDNLPINQTEEETLIILYSAAYMLAYDWENGEMSEEEKRKNLREIEECCNMRFTQNKPYRQQLWALADRIGAMYWDTDDEAKEMTMIYMLAKKSDFRFPASCYKNIKRVPFENTTIPIPADYEPILEAIYGKDYMIPKQGTAAHEYPFYKKQQKMLMDYYIKRGMEMPKELLE